MGDGGSDGRERPDAEDTAGRGRGGPRPAPAEPRTLVLAGVALRLLVPPDPDAWLDATTQEEYDATDGRLPYWAVLWPSALALAERVVAAERGLAGRDVLDLGCGLGLCGIAALHRGARTTFLDWEPIAVASSLQSARDAGFSACDGVVADWRGDPPGGPYDLVLGADVLYEERNGPAVAAFLASRLRPHGEAWIVDPGRRHASAFATDAARAGLVVDGPVPLPPQGDATTLSLFLVRRHAQRCP